MPVRWRFRLEARFPYTCAPNLQLGIFVRRMERGKFWHGIARWQFDPHVVFPAHVSAAGVGLGVFSSGVALLPMTVTVMAMMMTVNEKVVGRFRPKRTLAAGLAALRLAAALFARMPVGVSFVVHVLMAFVAGRDRDVSFIPPSDDHGNDGRRSRL